jgi:hypothetical protein
VTCPGSSGRWKRCWQNWTRRCETLVHLMKSGKTSKGDNQASLQPGTVGICGFRLPVQRGLFDQRIVANAQAPCETSRRARTSKPPCLSTRLCPRTHKERWRPGHPIPTDGPRQRRNHKSQLCDRMVDAQGNKVLFIYNEEPPSDPYHYLPGVNQV